MIGRPLSALRDFLKSEAGGGGVLVAATALALLAANLPATADSYAHLLHVETGPVLAPALGPMTVHLWVNDALMALFFLLVGAEIKRELVDGRLADPRRRRLPFLAAVTGMAIPATLYLLIAGGTPGLARGWAIPAATDIAFAVGILALLGDRVPVALKVFLTAVAIVDDMGAVAIIAIGYTDALDWPALLGAAGTLAGLAVLNRRGERRLPVYMVGFVLMWVLLLRSGVHATVAGVLTATAVPVTRSPGAPDEPASPLHRLEHALNPWVAYLIVPLFAFANAGLSFAGVSAGVALDPLVLGIAVALLVGKPLGILGAIVAAERTGFAPRPAHASWRMLAGVACLAGIGFTMSLFIGGLAFPERPELVEEVKLGVLAGSAFSALLGIVLLLPRRSVVSDERLRPRSAGTDDSA